MRIKVSRRRNPLSRRGPSLLPSLWDGLPFVSPHPKGEGKHGPCFRGGHTCGLRGWRCPASSLRALSPLPEGAAVELSEVVTRNRTAPSPCKAGRRVFLREPKSFLSPATPPSRGGECVGSR